MVQTLKTPIESRNTLLLSIILKLVIIVFSFIGFALTIYEGITQHTFIKLTYFTIISNIFILISTIAFLVSSIARYFNHYIYASRIFFILRFCALIAITITGFLFDFIMTPVAGISLLSSLDSVCFHVIVPFFSLIDFLVTNTVYKIRLKDLFLSLVYPLCYFAYVMTLSYGFNVRWDDGVSYAPYPFLDYHANTWFGKGDYIGVFYWFIILVAIFFAVAYLFKLFQYVVKKKHLHIFR